MLQSMTGFGGSERGIFKVEVRSLNHRYLEISVRVPTSLIEQEINIRNIIKKRIKRGKIDVFVTISDKKNIRVNVNKDLARQVYEAFSELQKDLNLPGSLDIGFFSGYKELFLVEEPSVDIQDMYEALEDALSNLEQMRKAEGEALSIELMDHLNKIEGICSKIKDKAKDRTIWLRDNLLKKIKDITADLTLDEVRIAQEVIFLAQKSDISEELERLKSHIEQFRTSLTINGSVGKKLDFIIQEMNREVNTIASKSDALEIIRDIVDLKLELERMREQVQNIQ